LDFIDPRRACKLAAATLMRDVHCGAQMCRLYAYLKRHSVDFGMNVQVALKGIRVSTIKEIEVIPLEYTIPPNQVYGTARGLNYKRSCPLIKVTTDTGISGYGEASAPSAPIRGYLATLKQFYVGRRIYDANLVAAYARAKLYHYGEGHFAECLSAIDVAIHDAIGQTLKLPVHDLIGGRARGHVPCYATTGYITQDGIAGLETQLAKVDRSIFSAVKIKIGINPRSDLERVRLARKMLGDDVLLMVDVNGNYTPDIALQSMKAIEPYNINWYEEPLPAHDLTGHAELRKRAPIPIATGESLHSVHEFKQLIDARGADILQTNLSKCGGLSGALAIATLADAAHLRLNPGCWGSAVVVAAVLQLVASRPSPPHSDNVPSPAMLEYDISDNPLRDRLVRNPIRPGPAGIPVPTEPGLGLSFDPDVLKSFSPGQS
jgi:D-galactarolactone cycloisomerase